MKFNFYALLFSSIAAYGILNAGKYNGPQQVANFNGQQVYKASKNKQDLNNYCEKAFAGDAEAIKACKMGAYTN